MNRPEDHEAVVEHFLAALADDPRYEFEIEPDFRRLQLEILELRGKEFWEWDEEVNNLDPVSEYLWLVYEARPLDLRLLHIEGYLGGMWAAAERHVYFARLAERQNQES